MSYAKICNEILDDIQDDAERLTLALQSMGYSRANKRIVEKLVIARRRLRLAMNKLDIPHGGE